MIHYVSGIKGGLEALVHYGTFKLSPKAFCISGIIFALSINPHDASLQLVLSCYFELPYIFNESESHIWTLKH